MIIQLFFILQQSKHYNAYSESLVKIIRKLRYNNRNTAESLAKSKKQDNWQRSKHGNISSKNHSSRNISTAPIENKNQTEVDSLSIAGNFDTYFTDLPWIENYHGNMSCVR